jgi:hypothetical protein
MADPRRGHHRYGGRVRIGQVEQHWQEVRPRQKPSLTRRRAILTSPQWLCKIAFASLGKCVGWLTLPKDHSGPQFRPALTDRDQALTPQRCPWQARLRLRHECSGINSLLHSPRNRVLRTTLAGTLGSLTTRKDKERRRQDCHKPLDFRVSH